MRIGIDCRLSGIEHAGIGRYIEELVRGLIEHTEITWVLFFHRKNQLPWLSKRANVVSIIAPVRHYTIAEQIALPIQFLTQNLDLLHVPHFNVPLAYTRPFVVTIHDLLWHDQQGAGTTTLSPWGYRAKYQAYRFVSSQAIRRSQAVLVPAETVKSTILTHVLGVRPEKIKVTYEGVDASWSTVEVSRRRQKILFYTGSLYPHKNVMLVVRALKDLPDYKLYISSSRNVFVDNFMKEVKAFKLQDRVKHLGRLTDDELRFWYSKATALVQPSLSEGFGLTGIEAMAASLPVLASDIPIFREVYGEACLYFDPVYEDSFVGTVKKLESSDHKSIENKGRKRADRYSWSSMVDATFSVYQQTLRG